ncbi:uncharacterized protein LOC133525322 [Cydia pomonella]|uniref:uncharacterized protein LOC133525322 n=1 Tax=Cydia pomonella TaxID=82600 RepID=UPI002ADE35FE|nr:uncharacterized protein LOC133525322 [Cydia pomonella]
MTPSQMDVPSTATIHSSPQNEPSSTSVTDTSLHPQFNSEVTIPSSLTNELDKSADREILLVLQPKTEKMATTGKNAQSLPENEHGIELNLIRQCTPSPTSSGLTSVLDTPKTSYYKKNLRICQKTIDLKINKFKI